MCLGCVPHGNCHHATNKIAEIFQIYYDAIKVFTTNKYIELSEYSFDDSKVNQSLISNLRNVLTIIAIYFMLQLQTIVHESGNILMDNILSLQAVKESP